MNTYQVATDPSSSACGHIGILHITAAGDAGPLCGRDDLALVEWSELMSQHEMGRLQVEQDHPTCGKCSDNFWETK